MSARAYIALVILAFILAAAMWRWRRLSTPFRFLMGHVVASFLVIPGAYYTALCFGNGMVAFHIFCIVSFGFIGLVYFFLFESKRSRQLVGMGTAIALLFALANMLWIQTSRVLPTYSISFGGVVFAVMAVYYFRHLLGSVNEGPVWRNSRLILNTSLFAYHVSTATIWGVYNTALEQGLQVEILNTANFVINLLVYFALAFVILAEKRQPLLL